MAKYRQVQCEYWINPRTEHFSSDDRLFYVMLLTNPRANQCGIYSISIKQMADYTKFDEEKIKTLLDRFITQYKKISYNEETKELAVLNWAKYNFSKSPKVVKCIVRDLEEIKDRVLIPLVYRSEQYLSLLIKYGYSMDTACKDYEGVSIDFDSLPEKEKEKEEQKEKEKREEKEKEKREEKQKEKITLDNLDQSVIHRCKKVFGKTIDEKTVPVLYKIQTKYGVDLIQLAIDQTLNEPSKSIDTTIAILEFWIRNGVTNGEQAKKFI